MCMLFFFEMYLAKSKHATNVAFFLTKMFLSDPTRILDTLGEDPPFRCKLKLSNGAAKSTTSGIEAFYLIK